MEYKVLISIKKNSTHFVFSQEGKKNEPKRFFIDGEIY